MARRVSGVRLPCSGPGRAGVHPVETTTKCWFSSVLPVDVVLVRWPTESIRRDRLVEEGVPRLLLLDEDIVPPEPADCLEDWVRVPASELDVRARVAGLAIRSTGHTTTAPQL